MSSSISWAWCRSTTFCASPCRDKRRWSRPSRAARPPSPLKVWRRRPIMACTAGRRRSCGVLYREIDSSQPGNGGVTMSAAASSLSKERQHHMKTSNQDEIVTNLAPLVKRIAYHLMSRLPPSVQADDLIQAGMIGLLEAARNYDAGQGASFETYAGIRIRGAMLDEIRRNDWAPRMRMPA